MSKGEMVVIGLWTVGVILFAFRSPLCLPVLLAIFPLGKLLNEPGNQ
jgi:hypothetical protein